MTKLASAENTANQSPTPRPDSESDDGEEAPETPPSEPEPVPVEDPPESPDKKGPYVVHCHGIVVVRSPFDEQEMVTTASPLPAYAYRTSPRLEPIGSAKWQTAASELR
jgi:hypothetical protein